MRTIRFIASSILLAAFAACNPAGDAPHKQLSSMDSSELLDYLHQGRCPADSASWGIARYALLSRTDNEYGNVRKNLEDIRTSHRGKATERAVNTDVALGLAVASTDRQPDSTVFHHLRQALPRIEEDVNPTSVMRRYTQAAYAAWLTKSEDGNHLTIDICQNAINFQHKAPQVPMRPEIYTYLGQATYDDGDQETALTNFANAQKIAHGSGNTLQEARAYAALSHGFKNEGLFLQEKMTAEKAYSLAKNAPLSETKGYVARTMGHAYENQQQHDSALFFLNMAYGICDSIHLNSIAADIMENDISRIEKYGCRQPDSMLAARAQYLQVCTTALIDMEKAATPGESTEPTLSHSRLIIYYAIGIGAIAILLSLIGLYIFRNYQRKLHEEKDAHLEGITERLKNMTSQYKSTSKKLLEFKERLDTAEENRNRMAQHIQTIEEKLSTTKDKLQEAQARLSNKEVFISNLREEKEEQERRLEEINRRFAHKDLSIKEASENPRAFARDFLAIHPQFEQALKERSTSISSHDILLCILIVLDVSKEDIANVLKIRPESLNVARHRLRTKLGLSRYDNLYTILRSKL